MLYSSNNTLSELELMSAHMPEIITIIRRKLSSISIHENNDGYHFLTDNQDQHVVSVSMLFCLVCISSIWHHTVIYWYNYTVYYTLMSEICVIDGWGLV